MSSFQIDELIWRDFLDAVSSERLLRSSIGSLNERGVLFTLLRGITTTLRRGEGIQYDDDIHQSVRLYCLRRIRQLDESLAEEKRINDASENKNVKTGRFIRIPAPCPFHSRSTQIFIKPDQYIDHSVVVIPENPPVGNLVRSLLMRRQRSERDLYTNTTTSSSQQEQLQPPTQPGINLSVDFNKESNNISFSFSDQDNRVLKKFHKVEDVLEVLLLSNENKNINIYFNFDSPEEFPFTYPAIPLIKILLITRVTQPGLLNIISFSSSFSEFLFSPFLLSVLKERIPSIEIITDADSAQSVRPKSSLETTDASNSSINSISPEVLLRDAVHYYHQSQLGIQKIASSCNSNSELLQFTLQGDLMSFVVGELLPKIRSRY